MHRLVSALIVLVVFLPSAAEAAEAITRRDGFLMLWEGISRPAEPWKKDAFVDVPKGERGYDEITFAHGRGMLDDTIGEGSDRFYPDDALTEGDAYLWLARTRNVDLPENLTPEALPGILEKHHLDPAKAGSTATVTAEELFADMRAFDDALAKTVIVSSNYGEELQGETTAFGEIFDWRLMTTAHRTLPYNTLLRVTNIDNGMSVIVRVNDRGPYVHGRGLDLSTAAFMAIAPNKTGLINVTIERLGDVTMVGPCTKEQRFARRVAPGVTLSPGIPHVLRLGQSLQVQSRQWFVVKNVTYPDGTEERFEDWVAPEESFTLKPAVTGVYRFEISTKDGRSREMEMEVADCSEQPGV